MLQVAGSGEGLCPRQVLAHHTLGHHPGRLCSGSGLALPPSYSPESLTTLSDEMRGDHTWEARGSAPRKCQGCLLLASVSSSVKWGCGVWGPSGSEAGFGV